MRHGARITRAHHREVDRRLGGRPPLSADDGARVVDLEDGPGDERALVGAVDGPQRVEQVVDGDRAPAGEGEQGEQRPPLRPPDVRRCAVDEHLKGPEHLHLQ